MATSDRAAQQKALRARVCRLLTRAGIRLADLTVERGAVAAAVAITNTYGAIDGGEITVGRRPWFDETDMFHANMGDPDCLDLAELVEITLRGLGFTVTRDNAVPSVVRFVAPAEDLAAVLDSLAS